MRAEWCRAHIDETAKQCGLGKSVVADVKLASRFCADHSDMSEFSTRAILALIRIRNDPLRDNVISTILKSLESGRHPLTGKILKTKKLSETDIRKVIEQADRSSCAPKSTESALRPKPFSLLAKEVDSLQIPAQSQSQPKVALHQSLTHQEKKALTEQFIEKCLTPERKKFLDNVIDIGHFETHLEVIEFLIDSQMVVPILDEVPLILPDNRINYSQQNNGPGSPESDKPWRFPTRPLTYTEQVQMFAEFVKVAFDPVLQERLHKVTIVRRLQNEMEALNCAIFLALPPMRV